MDFARTKMVATAGQGSARDFFTLGLERIKSRDFEKSLEFLNTARAMGVEKALNTAELAGFH